MGKKRGGRDKKVTKREGTQREGNNIGKFGGLMLRGMLFKGVLLGGKAVWEETGNGTIRLSNHRVAP